MVSDEVLSEVVQKATGSNLQDAKRLMLGEVNEVYDISTSEGQKIIVRISRNNTLGFKHEKWAIEQSKISGVSVPEILLIDKFKDKNKFITICVQKKLKGESLKNLLKKNRIRQDESKEIVKLAGGVLVKIHSVISQGFGWTSPEGKGKEKTWKEWIFRNDKEDKKEGYRKSAIKAGISSDVISKIYKLLHNHENLFNSVTPHLLHGDYGPDHIFVKDGKIEAIIDFENCKNGDPIYDLAYWDFFQSQLQVEWLEEGYTNKNIFDENYQTKLHLYKLHLGLDLLWYYVDQENNLGISITKRNLKKDLAYLRHNLMHV